MSVEIVEGDIVDQDVDVIVNAWNRNIIPWWLLFSGGVSRGVRRRAGNGPFRELRKHRPIPLGNAVLTGAGMLPHKAIIHVAGVNVLGRASERSIRRSVRNAISLAKSQHFRSVAFPVIGGGWGGFDEAEAVGLMVSELGNLEYDGAVIIVKRRKMQGRGPGGR